MTPPLIYFLMLLGGADDALPVAPKIAEAVITEVNGKAPHETEALGEQLRLTARSSVRGKDAKSVKWIVYPKSRSDRAYVSPDGLDVIIPIGLEPVTIQVILSVAVGDTTDVKDVIIECGKGPRPPPPNPDPSPNPTPTPLDDKALFIGVFHTTNVTPDQAIVLNDIIHDYGGSLLSRRHTVLRFDPAETSKLATQLKASAKFSAYPAVGLWELYQGQPSKLLSTFPLPSTTAEIDAQIKKYTSR